MIDGAKPEGIAANPQIYSPIATGNGAYVVHQRLARQLVGYQIAGYSPWLTLCPPLLLGLHRPADILHTTPDYAPFLWRRDQRRVITLHNYVLDPFMQAYSSALQRLHYRTDLRAFTRRALAGADIVTAVSAATAARAQEDLGFSGPIRVIYNGIDTDLFKPSSAPRTERSGPLRVLFCGNPTRRKGAHWLPAIIRGAGRGFEFWITAGLRGQPQLGRLAELPNVRLIPPRPHAAMPELYRTADVLLAPTVREGHSLAILEAMACGLPLVASALPEVAETVCHSAGGFLLPLGKTDDFVAALQQLRDNVVLRLQFGQYNARQVISEGWTETRMVEDYRQLFASLASGD